MQRAKPLILKQQKIIKNLTKDKENKINLYYFCKDLHYGKVNKDYINIKDKRYGMDRPIYKVFFQVRD